jgi:hypothetical protein
MNELELSESAIQQKCVMYYRNNYCLKIHNPRHLIFSVPNDIKNDIERMRKVSEGLYSGASDLIILEPGVAKFVEMKTETGTQSKDQKEFQQIVEALGFQYFLIRSLEQFKKELCTSPTTP